MLQALISHLKISLPRPRLRVNTKNELRIVMVGLKGSGKTSILYKLKLGETIRSLPTMGFNVESIVYKKSKLTLWDIGNQDGFESLMNQHFCNANALIFVVDSTDRFRVNAARRSLHEILWREDLRDCTVLVWCNKKDVDTAMRYAELYDALQIGKLRQTSVLMKPCSVHSSEGLLEGLDWLIQKTA